VGRTFGRLGRLCAPKKWGDYQEIVQSAKGAYLRVQAGFLRTRKLFAG
jgi:hypothetical protein